MIVMIKEIYYLELENYILDRWWNHTMYPLSEYCTGTKRLAHKPWVRLILRHLDGKYIHYHTWVINGGGDVWFC
jgi:hypothetical protein